MPPPCRSSFPSWLLWRFSTTPSPRHLSSAAPSSSPQLSCTTSLSHPSSIPGQSLGRRWCCTRIAYRLSRADPGRTGEAQSDQQRYQPAGPCEQHVEPSSQRAPSRGTSQTDLRAVSSAMYGSQANLHPSSSFLGMTGASQRTGATPHVYAASAPGTPYVYSTAAPGGHSVSALYGLPSDHASGVSPLPASTRPTAPGAAQAVRQLVEQHNGDSSSAMSANGKRERKRQCERSQLRREQHRAQDWRTRVFCQRTARRSHSIKGCPASGHFVTTADDPLRVTVNTQSGRPVYNHINISASTTWTQSTRSYRHRTRRG